MDIEVGSGTTQPTNEDGDQKDSESHPPTPSPEEHDSPPGTTNTFASHSANGPSSLTHTTQQQQQQQQQGSSRFRTVTQYVRERWQVEDKRSEDGGTKSGSAVGLPQGSGPLLQQQLSQLQSERSALSSSSATTLLLSTMDGKRDNIIESSVDLLERQDSKPLPRHVLAEGSRTPSSPGTMTPVEHSTEVNEHTFNSSFHSRTSSLSSGASSVHETVMPLTLEEDSSHKKDDNHSKDTMAMVPQLSVSSRPPIVEENPSTSPQSNTMQQHMDEVGDVLTKLQRLYGVISNDHSNLMNNYQTVKQELVGLREDHKSLKQQYEALKKENENLKKKNQKLESENKTKTLKKSGQPGPPSSSSS
jgi:phage shock protein A